MKNEIYTREEQLMLDMLFALSKPRIKAVEEEETLQIETDEEGEEE